jgi:hypothetical protein
MIGLTYITNQPDRAAAAVAEGVDRIMVDLEVLGKAARQAGRDTRISAHTLDDLVAVRAAIPKAHVMVRLDPLNGGSKDQIDACIQRGANRLMLPMFRSSLEAQSFVQLIAGRCAATLLLETASALSRLPEILEVNGFDEIFLGLNDLHVEMKLDFMFELLTGGLVDFACRQVRDSNRSFGFGGVGTLGGRSLVPPELILAEHRRMGSTRVMLSREFDTPWECARESRQVAMMAFQAHIRQLASAVLSTHESRTSTAAVDERVRVAVQAALGRSKCSGGAHSASGSESNR